MDKYNSPFPVPNTMLTKVSSISEKIGEIKLFSGIKIKASFKNKQ